MRGRTQTGLGIEELIGGRREDVLALAARYGVTHVRVFGSVARGEATENSDIDLLVRKTTAWSLLDRIRFQQALERLLGRPVDVVTERTLHPRIRERVLREAKWLSAGVRKQ